MTRVQCAKCPWRVGVNPHEIPGGYCEVKHAGLRATIASPGEFKLGMLRLMACHETSPGAELPCVGWLENQLGPGNNIALRLAVMTGRVDGDVRTTGRQHPTFAATLPKPAKSARKSPR